MDPRVSSLFAGKKFDLSSLHGYSYEQLLSWTLEDFRAHNIPLGLRKIIQKKQEELPPPSNSPKVKPRVRVLVAEETIPKPSNSDSDSDSGSEYSPDTLNSPVPTTTTTNPPRKVRNLFPVNNPNDELPDSDSDYQKVRNLFAVNSTDYELSDSDSENLSSDSLSLNDFSEKSFDSDTSDDDNENQFRANQISKNIDSPNGTSERDYHSQKSVNITRTLESKSHKNVRTVFKNPSRVLWVDSHPNSNSVQKMISSISSENGITVNREYNNSQAIEFLKSNPNLKNCSVNRFRIITNRSRQGTSHKFYNRKLVKLINIFIRTRRRCLWTTKVG